ncbi:MAG: hypothetical protein QOH50_2664, partial [Kribbellaceae bacterium]|nr:hypothetical protein [Kribbellaceae bacterium]
ALHGIRPVEAWVASPTGLTALAWSLPGRAEEWQRTLIDLARPLPGDFL